MLEPLDRETAKLFGLGGSGVGVVGVASNSPVARRGFGRGVLVEIDGVPVRTVRQVRRIISDARPGEVLAFRYLNLDPSGEPVGRTNHVRVPTR